MSAELASLIPAGRDDITAEWLAFVLGRRRPDAPPPQRLRFETTLGAEPGTNYATAVYAVDVTEERGAEPPARHRLIVKLPHDDPFGRFFCFATRCYEREILFYERLAPALERARGGRPAPVPRFYHGATDGGGRVVMVMDDLRAAGFRMPSAGRLDLTHLLLVVRALARTVGAGLALQRRPDAELLQAPLLRIETMWRGPRMEVDLIGAGLRGYIGFLRHYDGQQANVRKLEALLDSARDVMLAGMDGGGSLRSVCHGDLWMLNMMFRYPADDPAGAPDDVMLLDWQHCHFGNFMVDLFSVLVNNTDREFRRQHTQQVLRYFYDQLVLVLQEAELRPEDVGLSYDQLTADYESSKKAALMRVIFDVVLPLAAEDATRSAGENASPQEMVERLVEAMSVKTEDAELERRLLELVDEMNEQGVL